MIKKISIDRLPHFFSIMAIACFSALIFTFGYADVALAGDNYSAATDTYQETRNPNRVTTTPEELAKSNLDRVKKSEGESIYENLVEKVDSQTKEALNKKSKKSDR